MGLGGPPGSGGSIPPPPGAHPGAQPGPVGPGSAPYPDSYYGRDRSDRDRPPADQREAKRHKTDRIKTDRGGMSPIAGFMPC